jgi:hypothetical protein
MILDKKSLNISFYSLFQVHGILFKFALDSQYGLYGSDENAMKVAAHEWRG